MLKKANVVDGAAITSGQMEEVVATFLRESEKGYKTSTNTFKSTVADIIYVTVTNNKFMSLALDFSGGGMAIAEHITLLVNYKNMNDTYDMFKTV